MLRSTEWQVAVNISGLVVTILDSRRAFSSGRFSRSADELLDPNTMGVAVKMSLVSCILAEIHVISNLFPVSTAICDLRLTLMSHSNRNIPVVLMDSEKVSIAVGISLLSWVKLRYAYLKFRGHHLGFCTTCLLPLFLLDSWTQKT